MKFGDIKTFIDFLTGYATKLVPVIFVLCVFAFFYGAGKFIKLSSNNPEDASEAKNYLIYGVLGLFFAVSVWGLVRLVQGFLAF